MKNDHKKINLYTQGQRLAVRGLFIVGLLGSCSPQNAVAGGHGFPGPFTIVKWVGVATAMFSVPGISLGPLDNQCSSPEGSCQNRKLQDSSGGFLDEGLSLAPKASPSDERLSSAPEASPSEVTLSASCERALRQQKNLHNFMQQVAEAEDVGGCLDSAFITCLDSNDTSTQCDGNCDESAFQYWNAIWDLLSEGCKEYRANDSHTINLFYITFLCYRNLNNPPAEYRLSMNFGGSAEEDVAVFSSGDSNFDTLHC